MTAGFGELTEKARHLVAEGDLGRAQHLLADALAGVDVRPVNASPDLVEAAGLLARVLVALGEAHSARAWAAFAHTAATRLYGRADERSVTAAVTLAAVLHRVGAGARAARLYSEVIVELAARDGAEAHSVLAAHADLATVEYARGQCDVARQRLQNTWALHRKVYGDGHPSGIKMLAKLGAMERDCGRWAEAHEHLTLAKQLCRRHLPNDNPLTTQVTGLAQAIGDLEHVCGGPTSPSRDTPIVSVVAQLPQVVEGPVEVHLPEPPVYRPTAQAGSGSSNRQNAFTRPEATGNPLDDYRRPPDELFDEPWQPAESAPPRAVVGLTDCVPSNVGGVPNAAEADTPSNHPPPAPASSPPVSETRATQWLLLTAGVIVALLLGTIAIVATIFAPDPPDSESAIAATPSRASTPAATPSPTPAGSPDQVRLTDRRDSVVLHWRYPVQAEGPVVIAGGRSGQERRIFAELPAGTDSYTAHGLSRSSDYCFTIAVVWSTDTVAQAKPVCTHRGRPSAKR
ncbi:tetratricopeptide repeat protein [Micromonospora craterilacus]|uniref:Tetratricopeptide repeat protein n=1 Tax=Micromonospora craterilacus TaxID=1655439 RepID=A0A2W2DE31_9ACTN|nr:tetratricopeptide repeat protein [Micromonospora craterilacus]PZG10256.1 tetratricopeptide repeat protein [Micromonospora craterilacus]